MVVPLRCDCRRIVCPAVQEVHRADHIVERIGAENLCDSLLILEIADLDARKYLVLFLQLFDECEILVECVLELVRLQPFALKCAHKRIIKDEIVIVELLELRKGVRVLGESDLMNAALRRGAEEPLCIVLIVGAVLQMHMIVKPHNAPQSNSPARIRSQTSITPCSRLLGARYRARSFTAGMAFSIAKLCVTASIISRSFP